MCARRALPWLAIALGACGSRTPQVDPTPTPATVIGADASVPLAVIDAGPPPPARYLVTLLSATIEAKKASGVGWDEDDTAGGPSAAATAMTMYRSQHPELDGTDDVLGEPLSLAGLLKTAKKTDEPDPMVFVQTPSLMHRSPLLAGTTHPYWNFRFVVDRPPGGAGLITIVITDWDGPAAADVIGTVTVPFEEFVASRLYRVARAGNATELTFEVVPGDPGTIERRVSVQGKPTWTDTGIELTAGQSIIIDAAGEICRKGKSACGGPEGGESSKYNLDGFDDRPHGGLVAALGDTRFFVGRELKLRAPATGRLYLGVNDDDAGNNSGHFDARVRAH